MTENDLAFLKQAAEQLGLDADTAFVHVSPVREPCDHEWNNGGHNPDHCVKCGMSIMAHAFLECP